MKRKAYLRMIQHNLNLEEPVCTVQPMVERELQTLNEAQLNSIPDTFRCFCCQDLFPKKEIGGIELDQILCKFCYPVVDEWFVGTMIKFDTRRRFPIYEHRLGLVTQGVEDESE